MRTELSDGKRVHLVEITGVDWYQLCWCLNTFSNTTTWVNANDPSAIPEYREGIEQILEDEGLAGEVVLFISDCSSGGRDWEYANSDPQTRGASAYIPDHVDSYGGWEVVTEEDIRYVMFSSATSGSTIRAWRRERHNRKGEIEEMWWDLQLEVPIQEDGSPYEGVYWAQFHQTPDLLQEADPLWEEIAAACGGWSAVDKSKTLVLKVSDPSDEHSVHLLARVGEYDVYRALK